MGIYVGIEVFEFATDIRRLASVEIEIGLRHIGVAVMIIAFEQAERD